LPPLLDELRHVDAMPSSSLAVTKQTLVQHNINMIHH